MKEITLEGRTKIALEASLRAGEVLVNNLGKDRKDLSIETKGMNDFVTGADKASQQVLLDTIKEHFPEDLILAEEGEHQPQGKQEFTWIIDPLDGTTNFVHGLPLSSISIAYKNAEQVVGGVVYQPFLDEIFVAEKDKGSYFNGRKIAVTTAGKPEDALLGAAFPSRDYTYLKHYFNLQYELMQQVHDIRRLGSAAIDLCYVACGRFDAYCELGLKIWDIAAGSLILTEAGGKITDWRGGDEFWENGSFVASNTRLHPWLLEEINKHFFNFPESKL